MPELITKYPDIVLKVLRESGIECGTGATQRILTSCPAENFCSLPTGELCVYGLDEISQMTQISSAEIVRVASVASVQEPVTTQILLLILLALIIGMAIGIFLTRRMKKKK